MSTFKPLVSVTASTSTTPSVDPEWHVLILFADDTERDVKGIWGPYSTLPIAESALEELRQWPLDGFWDVRRLNKFIALKNSQWTWRTEN